MPEQEGFNQPQVPPSKPRKVWFIFSVVTVLILAATVTLIALVLHKAVAPAVKQAVISQTPATVAQDQAIVEKHLKSFIPAVTATSTIEQNAVPTALASFILPGATTTAFSQTVFADGTKGYAITYANSGDINSVYEQFFKASSPKGATYSQGFLPVVSALTNLAATLQEQSTKYLVSVGINAISTSTVTVTVTADAKK
jgi:hypothetical protein